MDSLGSSSMNEFVLGKPSQLGYKKLFKLPSISNSTVCSLLKRSSIAMAMTLGAVSAQGETITTELDFGSEYPIMLLNNESVTANIDLGYSFDSIESVCINVIHKSGEPNGMEFTSMPESPPVGQELLEIQTSHFFLRTMELVDPNDPTSGFIVNYQGDLDTCSVGILWENLMDGKSSVDIKPQGGDYEAWSFELSVTGVVSLTDIDLELDEDEGFTVENIGGRVNYDASIRNIDSNQTTKLFKQWSVLKLPNGEMYPIHKSNEVEINYNESRDYTRNYLNIPSWFAAGSYELLWYAADLSTGKITSESMIFTKDAFVPN